MMSAEQTAEVLGLSRAALYSLRARRTAPPAYHVAGRLRWRLSEVEAWLQQHRDEPEQHAV